MSTCKSTFPINSASPYVQYINIFGSRGDQHPASSNLDVTSQHIRGRMAASALWASHASLGLGLIYAPWAQTKHPTWAQHGVQEKRQDRSKGSRNLVPRGSEARIAVRSQHGPKMDPKMDPKWPPKWPPRRPPGRPMWVPKPVLFSDPVLQPRGGHFGPEFGPFGAQFLVKVGSAVS